MIESPNESLVKLEFKDAYGTIIEGVNVTPGSYSQYYYPIYMIRRMIYAILLVALAEYPKVQLILIPLLLNYPVFLLSFMNNHCYHHRCFGI